MAGSVTVEPVVLLFMFTVYMWYPLSTEMIYETMPGYEKGKCKKDDTVCLNKQKTIQEEVTRIQLYISAARHIPAVFSSLILGPFTDKHGRRPAMLLSLIGNAIWVLFMLFNVFFKFSPYYFILGCFIDGCFGGVGTYLFASFAYIADTSTEENRTKKVAITESMIFLGGFIASVTEGLLADKMGFAVPLFTVLVCYGIIVAYILFLLEEPRSVSSVRAYNYRQHFRKTISVIFSPSEDRSILWVTLVVFSLLAMAFAGTNNIIILFLLDEPYNWNKSGIGYFLAFNTLLNGIVTMFVLPKSSRFIGDNMTALVSVVATFIGFILLGVSGSDWMLFVGSTINAVGAMSIPTLRSKMSKMVSPNSQGSLFSLINSSEIFWALISSSAMSKIYEVTHDYYHGFCFLIESGLAFLAVGLIAVCNEMEKRKKEKNDNELLIIDDGDEPPLYVLTDFNESQAGGNVEMISMHPDLCVQVHVAPHDIHQVPPNARQEEIMVNANSVPLSENDAEGEDQFDYCKLKEETEERVSCGHATCSSNV